MAETLRQSLVLDILSSQNSMQLWTRESNVDSFETLATTPGDDHRNDSYFDQAIEDKQSISSDEIPLVAIIGVGYVGTHLISSFSRQYRVLGYDVSESRIATLKQENCCDQVNFTSKASDLALATHFLISVPTLLLHDKTIDSSYLQAAIKTLEIHGRPGSTVVFESSVAVGMTRRLLGTLGVSKRFYVGMSPERVDPGRTEPPMRSIPKIVSGLDDIVPGSLDEIVRLYSPVFDTVIPVSKPEVAEMTKLYENCQRMVCIAYANEMADACIPHDIDPYEVCSAATTKPFGYQSFTPSLGVGGHCIPVNPFYLLSNSSFPILQAATEKMRQRPSLIANRYLHELYDNREIHLLGEKARVLVVGMGFKRGQSVLSNSPSFELAKSLVMSGRVELMFADSLVKQEAIPQIRRLADEDWNIKSLESFEMIIVAYQQVGMDFDILDRLTGVHVRSWCS